MGFTCHFFELHTLRSGGFSWRFPWLTAAGALRRAIRADGHADYWDGSTSDTGELADMSTANLNGHGRQTSPPWSARRRRCTPSIRSCSDTATTPTSRPGPARTRSGIRGPAAHHRPAGTHIGHRRAHPPPISLPAYRPLVSVRQAIDTSRGIGGGRSRLAAQPVLPAAGRLRQPQLSAVSATLESEAIAPSHRPQIRASRACLKDRV